MIWWKIYFWTFTVLTLIGLPFINYSKLNIGDWLSIIISNVVALIGVFSLAYNKKLLSGQYWKVVFWVTGVFYVVNLIYELLLPENLKASFSILQSGLEYDKSIVIFTFIFGAPSLYALYKLAYKK